MKAISLWQPWASAVANGCKHWETRPKPTHCLIGRRIAIHAAARRTRSEAEAFDILLADWESRRFFEEHLEHGDFYALPFGAVVCTAVVWCCERTEVVEPKISTLERFWGNYAAGRYAWGLSDGVRLTKPVPMKFHQGINEIMLPDEALADHTGNQVAEFGDRA
jgi:hypothetical protein